jgi:hypothetical protein
MQTRFIAYIPLSSPAQIRADAVVSRIKTLYPEVPMEVSVAGDGVQNLISIDGTLIALMSIDQPLPQDAYVQALELNRTWQEAQAAMTMQRAHIIVGMVSEATTHGAALAGAAMVSMVTAAVTDLVPALAVIWSAGDVIIEPRAFQASALKLAAPEINVEHWIGFTWLDGPPTRDSKRTFAVLTTGLLPFIGREIEWQPTALPPVAIAERMYGTCEYLIKAGPVIGDNETLGISEQERIRVRHLARGQRPGLPILALTVENLEPVAPARSDPLPGLGGGGFGRKGLG